MLEVVVQGVAGGYEVSQFVKPLKSHTRLVPHDDVKRFVEHWLDEFHHGLRGCGVHGYGLLVDVVARLSGFAEFVGEVDRAWGHEGRVEHCAEHPVACPCASLRGGFQGHRCVVGTEGADRQDGRIEGGQHRQRPTGNHAVDDVIHRVRAFPSRGRVEEVSNNPGARQEAAGRSRGQGERFRIEACRLRPTDRRWLGRFTEVVHLVGVIKTGHRRAVGVGPSGKGLDGVKSRIRQDVSRSCPPQVQSEFFASRDAFVHCGSRHVVPVDGQVDVGQSVVHDDLGRPRAVAHVVERRNPIVGVGRHPIHLSLPVKRPARIGGREGKFSRLGKGREGASDHGTKAHQKGRPERRPFEG